MANRDKINEGKKRSLGSRLSDAIYNDKKRARQSIARDVFKRKRKGK